MQIIDTHCHITDSTFDSDFEAIMARCRTAGVAGIIAVGITASSSEQTIELSQGHELVYPAVGIHPNYANEAGTGDWDRIVELAANPNVVAIGETGLDRFRSDTAFDLQVDYFERHLRLARDRDLPVIIHCREAESDVLEALSRLAQPGGWRGVMHSFTGTAATAARCVELGLYISFAGQLTFTNRKFDALRELARSIPADRLLVETDSPYLAPEPHRGERNEPSYVTWTVQRLAELRGITLVECAELCLANSRALFRLPEGSGTHQP